jgi:serine/threonine-protein kinase HipA
MDENGSWQLAPAYDLTFSAGIAGYHTTSIAGESRTPTVRDMLRLARDSGLDARQATRAIDEVDAAVAQWPDVARALDISGAVIARVGNVLDETRRAAQERRGPL